MRQWRCGSMHVSSGHRLPKCSNVCYIRRKCEGLHECYRWLYTNISSVATSQLFTSIFSYHWFFFPLVFNTDWVDTHLNSTEGEDNIPGSTRSFGLEITEGIYPFTEEVSEPFPNLHVTDLTFVQLLAFNIEPDGSFIQRVGQFNIPVEYSFKNGSLSGLWVTLKADYAAQYETAVNWSVYACFTGHPISFVDFMSSGINNAISVLNSKGLAKGQTLGPFAVQSF